MIPVTLDQIRLPSGKILVQLRDKEEEVSEGGIFLPENRRRGRILGSIVMVGPRPKDEEDDYSVGEMVCIKYWDEEEALVIDKKKFVVVDWGEPSFVIRATPTPV